jgi:zinc transport system substrate-binding protein
LTRSRPGRSSAGGRPSLRNWWGGSRRRRIGPFGLSLVATTMLLPACGGTSVAATHAPTIQVVTGLYPLAQAVEQIGQDKVAVTNVVPAGADPMTYHLTAAQVGSVHRAALVVQVGDGFQPSLEAASTGAQAVLNLAPQLGVADPYVWLDPGVMGRAVEAMAAALERANPPATALYQQGARAFSAEVASTGIDYESTLSTCARDTIVTPDSAFLAMARDYNLTDDVVGATARPPAAAVTAAANRVNAAELTTVFSEPFASDGTIRPVAAAAHVKVRALDTLTGPPPGGWPRQANYLNLMEANLGTLSNALGCPNSETGE